MARRPLPLDPFNDRSGDARRFFLEGIPSRKNPKGIKQFAEGSFTRIGQIHQSKSFNQFAYEMLTSGKMDRRIFMRHVPSFTESKALNPNLDYPEDYFLSYQEIQSMSPEDLNTLMQQNALKVQAMDRKAERQGWVMKESGEWVKRPGAHNEGSFEDGDKDVNGYIQAWQDGKVTNDDQARTGSLIRTGMDGMDEKIPGEQEYNYLKQYQWIKENPKKATKYVGLQYERDLKNNAPSVWQKIFVGGLTAASAAALFGPVLGFVGSTVGGTAGTAISSGAAIGAAAGASSSAATGGDPLMGAIKGGIGGFILQDAGLGDWLMDKATSTFGEGAVTTPEEAAVMLSEEGGVSVPDLLQSGGEEVYGGGFDLETSGAIVLDPIQVTAPAPVASPGVDIPALLGGGAVGLTELMTGEYDIMPEESARAQGERGMNTPGFGLDDLIGVGKGGLGLYEYLAGLDNPEELRQIYEEGAKRADPWAPYREGYADKLNTFMQEEYTPVKRPERQSPLDRILNNPFKSEAGIAKFIREEETPLEYVRRNPFETRSGLFDFLEGTESPTEYQKRNPFKTRSGLFDFLQNTTTPLEFQQENPFQSQSGLLDLLKDPSSITESPAYQFRLNQGLQALDRRLAKGGYRFSGNRMTALNDYAQQAASQEFENEFGRRQSFRGLEQQQYQNLLANYLQGYGTEAQTRLGTFGTEADQYSQQLANYLQGYQTEAQTRLGTFGKEADQYNQEIANYLRGYAGTLNSKIGAMESRFGKYKDTMDLYSDNYSNEFEQYLKEAQLQDLRRQNKIRNLSGLAGVNPQAQLEGQQQQTLGRVYEQQQEAARLNQVLEVFGKSLPSIIDIFT